MSDTSTELDKGVFALGLLIPGAGQLRRGDFYAAFVVLLSTTFLWSAATLEVVVNNMRGYPAPLDLGKELAALKSPLIVVPHVIVAVICAVSMHAGAAWFAARSSARDAAKSTANIATGETSDAAG